MHSRFYQGVVAVVASCTVSLGAFAGMRTIEQVKIADEQSWASGDLGYARSTNDTVQYIGCYIIGSGSGSSSGHCSARNAAGVTRKCSTNQPKWLDIIASLNGDSNLYFRWNSEGQCTMIIVEQNSTLAPKLP
jgi:hypothetical protein